MAKKLKIIVLVTSYLFLFVFFFKYCEELTVVKSKLYDLVEPTQQTYRDGTPIIKNKKKNRIDFSSYPYREYSGEEWFAHTDYIYHACGEIEGTRYSNSREAIEYTLAHGGKVVEVDFSFTSDGELVCLHDWGILNSEKPLTYSEFMNSLICDKYAPISIDDVFEYLENYPEMFIVVDTKESIFTVIEMIVSKCKSSAILDRFIIQTYYPGEKEKILSLYDFPQENFLFSVYKFTGDSHQVLKLCYDENISVITVPYGYIEQCECESFFKNNFIVYEHTINNVDEVLEQKKHGVRGFYTDCIFK